MHRWFFLLFLILLAGSVFYPIKLARSDPPPISGSSTINVTVVTETPVPPPPPAGGGGGGGGGGGIYTPPTAVVEFKGLAYPSAPITALKDGTEAGLTRADQTGNFTFIFSGLTAGTYNFGFWAQDKLGRRSTLFTFQLIVASGSTTKVSGIVLPPTIGINKQTFSLNDQVVVAGAAVPNSQIRIQVASDPREFITKTLFDGDYVQSFSTAPLGKGVHTIKSKTEIPATGDDSIFSQLLAFGVGVAAPQTACSTKPDVNGDSRVNLIDFSIMAYWWKRSIPPDSPVDLNCDGILNLADFSIMAFAWSG